MPPRAVRSRRYPQSLAMAKSQRIAESRMQIQGPTCPMSVCLFVCLSLTCVRSAGCQTPKKPRREHNIPIATWSRELQEEFEDYKRADHDGRRLLWYKWTKLERRSVEGAAPRLRAEMRTFKEGLLKLAEQPVVCNSQGQVPQSSSWVRDQTQDGDVHSNPRPPKKDHGSTLSDGNRTQTMLIIAVGRSPSSAPCSATAVTAAASPGPKPSASRAMEVSRAGSDNRTS